MRAQLFFLDSFSFVLQNKNMSLQIRRVLFSVWDKAGLIPLAKAFLESGAELIASGGTAGVLKKAGMPVSDISELTHFPSCLGGRVKTLSSQISAGILYRRGQDEAEIASLEITPIDAVVVNFYPFEKTFLEKGISAELSEMIDIGGPTLVRAGAKNAPHVLTLTRPSFYPKIIEELSSKKNISNALVQISAKHAWEDVFLYDQAIYQALFPEQSLLLRYGENPHQKGVFLSQSKSPLYWTQPYTQQAFSYNNILDFSTGALLLRSLKIFQPQSQVAIVMKHTQACGVAVVDKTVPNAQAKALQLAWDGDPVSAFGSVVLLSHPLEKPAALFLREHFFEGLAVPKPSALEQEMFSLVLEKRKRLKILTFNLEKLLTEPLGFLKREVLGGTLIQTVDVDSVAEELPSCTWAEEKKHLAQFGIIVGRSALSNTVVIVRSVPDVLGGFQLLGLGSGQPNRVDAFSLLALPRAKKVLPKNDFLENTMLVSDAFFPFPDTIEKAFEAGIRWVVAPSGSRNDAKVKARAEVLKMRFCFSSRRHFRH